MKDWGESVSELMIKNQLQETVLSYFGCFYLLYMFYSNLSPGVLSLVISCVVCNCCWLAVCIVVVVLCVCVCVLLSYVYLLYYVCIAVFYFRCRTAG